MADLRNDLFAMGYAIQNGPDGTPVLLSRAGVPGGPELENPTVGEFAKLLSGVSLETVIAERG